MTRLAGAIHGIIGVDTHRDTLAAAATDPVGGVLAQTVQPTQASLWLRAPAATRPSLQPQRQVNRCSPVKPRPRTSRQVTAATLQAGVAPRTYGANPLSIQVRKRWTLSAGHGP